MTKVIDLETLSVHNFLGTFSKEGMTYVIMQSKKYGCTSQVIDKVIICPEKYLDSNLEAIQNEKKQNGVQ